eukprot:gnl/TRDRNA2_/TRDRNA2_134474_c2_seq1.p1 gnl/TRDRNA2_/TRDRNA2_134474_c2~~gnl/TRDRNA2_/TRDRNA2_134474_c2_seq1.p1  ORF type:complete len:469 (+),score=88.76 gnl/TRDRNA2_/TRDRNA2_134474_c2_seq1:122-1408(+)
MWSLLEVCIEPLMLRPILERQPALLIFFGAFIFFMTFGMMNVIIGVIVERVLEENHDCEEDQEETHLVTSLKYAPKLCDLTFANDKDKTVAKIQELSEVLMDQGVAEEFKRLKLPEGFADDDHLFHLLDSEGLGEVNRPTVQRSLLRLLMHDSRRNLLELQLKARRLQRQTDEQINIDTEHQARLAAVEEELGNEGGFGRLEEQLASLTRLVNRAIEGCRSRSMSPVRQLPPRPAPWSLRSVAEKAEAVRDLPCRPAPWSDAEEMSPKPACSSTVRGLPSRPASWAEPAETTPPVSLEPAETAPPMSLEQAETTPQVSPIVRTPPPAPWVDPSVTMPSGPLVLESGASGRGLPTRPAPWIEISPCYATTTSMPHRRGLPSYPAPWASAMCADSPGSDTVAQGQPIASPAVAQDGDGDSSPPQRSHADG